MAMRFFWSLASNLNTKTGLVFEALMSPQEFSYSTRSPSIGLIIAFGNSTFTLRSSIILNFSDSVVGILISGVQHLLGNSSKISSIVLFELAKVTSKFYPNADLDYPDKSVVNSLKVSSNFPSVIFIGLVQVIAFLPGTSRAGIVITACRILGFERKDAARFSLLLSVPAILGASTLELIELINSNNSELSWYVLYASIFSFILSICSIFLMMKWLSFASFTPFVIYRILLGTILLLAIYFW